MKLAKREGAEPSQEDRDKLEAMKIQKREIMKSIKDIAAKYEIEIKRLHEEIEPERAQWKEDMMAIKKRHVNDDAPRGPYGNHERKARRSLHETRVGFILMDPAGDKAFNLEQSGHRFRLSLPGSARIHLVL